MVQRMATGERDEVKETTQIVCFKELALHISPSCNTLNTRTSHSSSFRQNLLRSQSSRLLELLSILNLFNQFVASSIEQLNLSCKNINRVTVSNWRASRACWDVYSPLVRLFVHNDRRHKARWLVRLRDVPVVAELMVDHNADGSTKTSLAVRWGKRVDGRSHWWNYPISFDRTGCWFC